MGCSSLRVLNIPLGVLRARNLTVDSEVKVPVRYKEFALDGFYRLDLLVNDASAALRRRGRVAVDKRKVEESFAPCLNVAAAKIP